MNYKEMEKSAQESINRGVKLLVGIWINKNIEKIKKGKIDFSEFKEYYKEVLEMTSTYFHKAVEEVSELISETTKK